MNKNLFAKILAILGTALVWLPLLAPVVLAFAAWGTRHRFLFDYLMPAELFPFALAGALLLIWAAWQTRSRLRLIAWGTVGAAAFFFGMQALAVVTGLASGASEPTGWRWMLVMAALAVFWAALNIVGVGGILLLRGLFRKPASL